MKKTLIASAVSAALMAPVAAQAEDMAGPEVSVYGRIHQGIKIENPDTGDRTTDFVGIGSRFGIKASSDLGNGMTASAQYEFATNSDKGDDGVTATRVAKVGVSGAFGSVDLGNQWGAYYNLVGVHMDPTFWVGGSTYYLGADPGIYGPMRTANTIQYSNSFGPVSIAVDVRTDDTKSANKVTPVEGGDGYAAAASFAVNDNITFAAGVDNDDMRDIVGGGVKVSLGNYWASIATHRADIEAVTAVNAVPNTPGVLGMAAVPAKAAYKPSATQFWAGGSFGNTSVMVGAGKADMDMANSSAPGNKPSDITWAVYHDMGGGLGLLYEGISMDSDNTGNDKTVHLFGVRLDF